MLIVAGGVAYLVLSIESLGRREMGSSMRRLLIYSFIYQTKGQVFWGQSVVSDAPSLSLKLLVMGALSYSLVAFCAVFVRQPVSFFVTSENPLIS